MYNADSIVKSMRNGIDGVTPENTKRAFSGALVTRGNTDFELFHYNSIPIANIKCYDAGKNVKIVFDWPRDVCQVCIYAKQERNPDNTMPDIKAIDISQCTLFTLQEYKKLGGYITPKVRGQVTYCIFATEGSELLHAPKDAAYSGHIVNTCVTKILYHVTSKEKSSFLPGKNHMNHEVVFSSRYPVKKNVICYAKTLSGQAVASRLPRKPKNAHENVSEAGSIFVRLNEFPKASSVEDLTASDHVNNSPCSIFYISEKIEAASDLRRVISTACGEEIHFFIADDEGDEYVLEKR